MSVACRQRPSGEGGVAAVLVLALAGVLALLGATASAVAAVAVARQRAAAVADLAALAAAQHALEGSSAACGWAARVSRSDGAALVRCVLDGDVADVVVQVRPPGRLGALGAATSRARAGPHSTGSAGTSAARGASNTAAGAPAAAVGVLRRA